MVFKDAARWKIIHVYIRTLNIFAGVEVGCGYNEINNRSDNNQHTEHIQCQISHQYVTTKNRSLRLNIKKTITSKNSPPSIFVRSKPCTFDVNVGWCVVLLNSSVAQQSLQISKQNIGLAKHEKWSKLHKVYTTSRILQKRWKRNRTWKSSKGCKMLGFISEVLHTWLLVWSVSINPDGCRCIT